MEMGGAPIVDEAELTMENRLKLELTAWRVAVMLLLDERNKGTEIEHDWCRRVMADHLAHREIAGDPFKYEGPPTPEAEREAQMKDLQACDDPNCQLAWENWRAMIMRRRPLVAVGPLTAQLLDERWGLSYAVPTTPGDAVRVWMDKKSDRIERVVLVGDGGNA